MSLAAYILREEDELNGNDSSLGMSESICFYRHHRSVAGIMIEQFLKTASLGNIFYLFL